MDELKNIPHIDAIANRGPYSGAEPKRTATFQERAAQQNKIMPSLESAILASGLKDGMTISFHHHFRGGDHVVNQVVDTLARMGYKNLTLAASSLAAVHAPPHRPHQKRRHHPHRDLRSPWGTGGADLPGSHGLPRGIPQPRRSGRRHPER